MIPQCSILYFHYYINGVVNKWENSSWRPFSIPFLLVHLSIQNLFDSLLLYVRAIFSVQNCKFHCDCASTNAVLYAHLMCDANLLVFLWINGKFLLADYRESVSVSVREVTPTICQARSIILIPFRLNATSTLIFPFVACKMWHGLRPSPKYTNQIVLFICSSRSQLYILVELCCQHCSSHAGELICITRSFSVPKNIFNGKVYGKFSPLFVCVELWNLKASRYVVNINWMSRTQPF